MELLEGGSREATNAREEIKKFLIEKGFNDEEAIAITSLLYDISKKKFPNENNTFKNEQMLELIKDEKIYKKITKPDNIKKKMSEIKTLNASSPKKIRRISNI